MNKKQSEKPERRVVNIPKRDFDRLSRYCRYHGLNLPRWLVIQADLAIQKAEQVNSLDLTN